VTVKNGDNDIVVRMYTNRIRVRIESRVRNFLRSNVPNNDGKRDNLVIYNNLEMQWCRMKIYTVRSSRAKLET